MPIITHAIQVFSVVSERTIRMKTRVSHQQMCDCICAHNAEGARAAVIAHLEANRQNWDRITAEKEEN